MDYSDNNFESLFDLKPEKYSEVTIKRTLPTDDQNTHFSIVSHRYHKSYLNTPKFDDKRHKNYMFKGLNEENDKNLPKEFQPFYDYIRKFDPDYNQVTINWFENGLDFIPNHIDCQVDLVENSNIVTISLGCERTFRILKFKECQEQEGRKK
jgi:alkylated DNA repair dioxygenase AlkB